MTNVFIIEDEPLLRGLLFEILKDDEEIVVVGTSGDGKEGLEACREMRPDMVILDINLPSLNGRVVSGRLKADHPGTKVLIYSAYFTPGEVAELVGKGVEGILHKSVPLPELEKGIREVAAGGFFLGEKIRNLLPGGTRPAVAAGS